MKKFIMIVLLMMVGGAAATTYAQQSKEYKKMVAANKKEAEKIAKKKAKEIKKEKWEYTGVLPLETALTNYYISTIDFGGTMEGIEHEVNNQQTMSAAERTLLYLAQSVYAQEIESYLGGKLAEDFKNRNGVALEQLAAETAMKLKHEFSGDVRRVILLKRRTSDGRSWDVRGYFLIDREAGFNRADKAAERIKNDRDMIDDAHERVFGE